MRLNLARSVPFVMTVLGVLFNSFTAQANGSAAGAMAIWHPGTGWVWAPTHMHLGEQVWLVIFTTVALLVLLYLKGRRQDQSTAERGTPQTARVESMISRYVRARSIARSISRNGRYRLYERSLNHPEDEL